MPASAVDVQPVPGTSKLVVAASASTREVVGPLKSIIHSRRALYLVDVADGSFTLAVGDANVFDSYRQLAAPHAGGEYAFADPDKGVVITDVTTGKSRTVKGCPVRPLACRFSPSDRYLFVGGCGEDRAGGLAVYDLTTEEWVGAVATKGWVVLDLSYSASANLLTCTSGSGVDRQITVWDMKGIVDPAAKKKEKK